MMSSNKFPVTDNPVSQDLGMLTWNFLTLPSSDIPRATHPARREANKVHRLRGNTRGSVLQQQLRHDQAGRAAKGGDNATFY
jgi:hypothetical protein